MIHLRLLATSSKILYKNGLSYLPGYQFKVGMLLLIKYFKLLYFTLRKKNKKMFFYYLQIYFLKNSINVYELVNILLIIDKELRKIRVENS